MRTKIFIVFACVFVSQCSLSATPYECVDGKCVLTQEKTSAYKALDCLNKAINLAKKIKDKDEKETVLNFLKSDMSKIQMAIMTNDYKTISETALCLYENADEILAECSDSELRQEISSCICNMCRELPSSK